jgi:hypothetical protein
MLVQMGQRQGLVLGRLPAACQIKEHFGAGRVQQERR